MIKRSNEFQEPADNHDVNCRNGQRKKVDIILLWLALRSMTMSNYWIQFSISFNDDFDR